MRKPARSTFVILIAILQMVVGGLLLACGGITLGSAASGSSATTVTISTGGQTTTRTYDTQAEMQREAPSYNAFLFGGGAANILLHVAMIAGAVGLLTHRAWGWWVSLAWAVLRLVYQVATTVYLWTVAMPAANRMVKVVPRDDAGVCSGLVNGNTFYHLFWALFSTAFVIYPLVILILLILPPVRRAFSPQAARADDDDEDDRRDRRRRYRDEDEDEYEEDDEWERRRRPRR